MKFPSTKYSILIVLSISVYLFQIWFAGGIGGFEMLVMTAFLSIVVASVFSLVGIIFGRKTPISWQNILKVFLIISSLHAILHILLFGFFFYQNSISPAYLGRVTLSNGQKELVFQNMSHIATRSFYEGVTNDVAMSTASGYTVFYEGVGSGSVESEEKLDDLLGLKLEPYTYGIIASIVGLEDQDYREIFRSVTDRSLVKNVDLPLDTLIKLYNTKSGSTTKPEMSPVDMENILSGVTLRPQERQVIGFIGRGFLNFLLKQDTSFLLSGENGLMDKNLLDIILHERNEYIASVIQSSEKQKIYALYGALHFDGVFAELKRLDRNWKILSVESIRPY